MPNLNDERATPQEMFLNPVEDLTNSLSNSLSWEVLPREVASAPESTPAVEPTPEPVATEQTPESTPAVEPTPEPTPVATESVDDKKDDKIDFDAALEELEIELWLKKVEEEKPEPKKADDEEITKSLDRDQKFLTIIKELDSTNRNSLKRVSELEVEIDKAQTQAALYKQQAHEYYEELRANEFDRSKFQVDNQARNFVHYFNEYASDPNNTSAKNWALREAIKIVNKITGRDLNNYLVDYFSLWSADMSNIWLWNSAQLPNFNVSPNRAKDKDSQKINALNTALEGL